MTILPADKLRAMCEQVILRRCTSWNGFLNDTAEIARALLELLPAEGEVMDAERATPVYGKLNGPDLLAAMGDNALKWAEAFQEIIVDAGKPIDISLMTSWFANSIEYSNDVRRWAKEKEDASHQPINEGQGQNG